MMSIAMDLGRDFKFLYKVLNIYLLIFLGPIQYSFRTFLLLLFSLQIEM